MEQIDRVRDACETIGRDPATMTFSAALVVCCGGDDAEVIPQPPAPSATNPTSCGKNGAAGTPAEVMATLQRWESAGAQRVHLQILDLSDLDHLQMIADSVGPAFA